MAIERIEIAIISFDKFCSKLWQKKFLSFAAFTPTKLTADIFAQNGTSCNAGGIVYDS